MVKHLYKITYNLDDGSYSFHRFNDKNWEVITDLSYSIGEIQNLLDLLGAIKIEEHMSLYISTIIYAL